MAYKEILPQTNLDAVDIRDTIGCPSNNLADYCTKAKSGGIGGYAFRIVENGYLPSDGYLIQGASPYFNIYSNDSPSEWVVGEVTNAVCRLKRNYYGNTTVSGKLFDANSYCFDLGTYRGYRHKAKAPHSFSLSAIATPLESGQYEILLGFFRPGDYQWRKLDPNTPIDQLFYSIESSNANIPHNDTTMTPYNEAADHFGIAVKWVGNYPPSKIKAKLGLYRKRDINNYLPIAYLPMEASEIGNIGGNIELEVSTSVLPRPEPTFANNMRLFMDDSFTTYYRGSVYDYEQSYLPGRFRIFWSTRDLDRRISVRARFVHDGIIYLADSVSMHVEPNYGDGGEDSGEYNYSFSGTFSNIPGLLGGIDIDVWVN